MLSMLMLNYVDVEPICGPELNYVDVELNLLSMLNYVNAELNLLSMLNLIYCRYWTMNIHWLSCNCFDYLVITPLWFDYLVHVAIFSILGQQWLANTQSSRKGRPETATGGLLLPQATPLLLPHATRWETPAAAVALLCPRVCRRWEAPAVTAPLLLPPPTRMTQWRCVWWLLLRHAWRLLLLWHAFGSDPTS
jgi:hypothetical protein